MKNALGLGSGANFKVSSNINIGNKNVVGHMMLLLVDHEWWNITTISKSD